MQVWSFGVLTSASQNSRPDRQLDGPEGSVDSLLLSKSHHLHGPAVDAPLIVAMDEHLPNCGLEVSAFNRGQKRNVKLTRLGELLHHRFQLNCRAVIVRQSRAWYEDPR